MQWRQLRQMVPPGDTGAGIFRRRKGAARAGFTVSAVAVGGIAMLVLSCGDDGVGPAPPPAPPPAPVATTVTVQPPFGLLDRPRRDGPLHRRGARPERAGDGGGSDHVGEQRAFGRGCGCVRAGDGGGQRHRYDHGEGGLGLGHRKSDRCPAGELGCGFSRRGQADCAGGYGAVIRGGAGRERGIRWPGLCSSGAQAMRRWPGWMRQDWCGLCGKERPRSGRRLGMSVVQPT